MRSKKHAFLAVLLAGVMCLSGCQDAGSSGETTKSHGEGLSFSETKDDITVELYTDKASYEAGEELHYTLSIQNDRKGYTVSLVQIDSTNAEEFSEDGYPFFEGTIPQGESKSYEGRLIAFSDETFSGRANAKQAVTGDVETVTFRPYVKVPYGDTELTVRYVLEITLFQERVGIPADARKTLKTVSVHDPSIVVGTDPDGDKCYYIFGSHRAWAKSYDLQNWEYFTNNLSDNYREILAEPASWSAHGSSNYKVDGFMWAPDVIYNEAMGKYCMYLSVDGDYWYSSIVLLTADTIEGDWTYVGPVVYSGFRTDEFYDECDVALATGEETLASRYSDRKWGDYYPNCIDPCVFYDEMGKLWMSYGSWSGGIFMLELDEATGLRDYTVSYEDSQHSDPYFGTKIAGGMYVSGEASYIQHIGDYYYLFVCYGGLSAKEGYNVRIFRSTRPDGDYVDALGNSPYFDTYKMNFNLPVGVRLFGGYKWRNMIQGQVAQGHNSAFVDEDERAYIVFHTRTTDGSEGHYVKVHELFMNEDGWPLASPYVTSNEKLDPSVSNVETVAGDYDVILHQLYIDYANYEVNKPQTITLNPDGTITGSVEGSWELAGDNYIHLTFDGVTYKGLVYKMEVEGSTLETVVFTALGDSNELTLWGSKLFD